MASMRVADWLAQIRHGQILRMLAASRSPVIEKLSQCVSVSASLAEGS